MSRKSFALFIAGLVSLGFQHAVGAEPQTAPTRNSLPKEVVTREHALEGWIALFDHESTFGFRDGRIEVESTTVRLQGGTTTTEFADFELKIDVVKAGTITLAGESSVVQRGQHVLNSRGRRGPIALSAELVVRDIQLKPLALKPLWNGRDLTGWDRRGRVPAANKPGARWSVENGAIRVVGGPEALEYAPAEGPHLFGDFIVQMVVRTRRPGANGGFFFRNEPGKTMMGYEAQLHNTWYDPESGQHGYTTGGIDDRQQARAPVAIDDVPFRMTVIAQGSHIATWVNGYQTADWVDTRPADPNPEKRPETGAGDSSVAGPRSRNRSGIPRDLVARAQVEILQQGAGPWTVPVDIPRPWHSVIWWNRLTAKLTRHFSSDSQARRRRRAAAGC